jgi:hypothetical protein
MAEAQAVRQACQRVVCGKLAQPVLLHSVPAQHDAKAGKGSKQQHLSKDDAQRPALAISMTATVTLPIAAKASSCVRSRESSDSAWLPVSGGSFWGNMGDNLHGCQMTTFMKIVIHIQLSNKY